MKIEPRKTASLPKYALLLAASAALLTGCDFNRPVATDGTAPDPNVQIDGDVQIIDQPDPDIEVQLAGEEQFCPDMTTTTTEVMLEGEANPYETDVNADGTTVTTTVPAAAGQPPMIAGSVMQYEDPSAEDFTQLEGDVAVVLPDAQRAETAQIYQEVFAAQGFRMTECPSGETGLFCGTVFPVSLTDDSGAVQIVFYQDGAAVDDISMREWMDSCCTKIFDWGGVLEQKDASGGSSRVLFIDMSRTVADYAADTAQIVKDAGL